ncbi:hypothetical protein DQ04_01831060 [Trypanosoma grayi]|uniref:hypothetical protein n=1 Tax=Trypanosoma grayi TaxID=71804 RepID=UPI0004F40909|nr:hypothetical protein DQ04_01831060 [Trypanosoma grayi]KEG12288.1 hypothetical protein DQ04_01831060 [Trypanosoma grayi]
MVNGAGHSAKCVYVLSDIDGFKYKLVMEGDVHLLTTTKVKRYLQHATGLSPQHQELSFKGRIMQDGECGGDIGLTDGAMLRLQHVHASQRASSSAGAGGSRPSSRSMSASTVSHQGKATVAKTFVPISPMAGSSTPLQSGRHRDAHGFNGELAGPPRADTSFSRRDTRTEREYRELELENARLEERLLEAERELANARSDWRLQEEVEQLKCTIAQLESEKAGAARAAEEKWQVKQAELVKELDIMREERRRLRREQAFFEQEQRALVHALEGQIRTQQKELVEQETRLEKQREELRCANKTVSETVQCSLEKLSQELNISPLKLDDNDTCVVPLSDGANILITLDPATERMFMYATIANTLPSSAEVRLRLFETLLEGSLLGRDMAGGGVGICTLNNLIIMDICVDVAHADEYALASVVRPFMAAAQHWMEVIKNLTSQQA